MGDGRAARVQCQKEAEPHLSQKLGIWPCLLTTLLEKQTLNHRFNAEVLVYI